MAFPPQLFFFAVLIAGVLPADIAVSQLSAGMIEDLNSIVKRNVISRFFLPSCGTPTESDVLFLLYTRNNPVNPINVDVSNLTQIDPSKKIVVLIHGWISGPTNYGFPEMRQAYLKRYDCNVIIVNWSKLAWKLYSTSKCSVPGVGQLTADLLCALRQEFDISLGSIHIVGHGLGAHLAGFAGKYAKSTCGQKIGRITGLDPAGPLYQFNSASKRLDKTDALFVDVIHTNALQFGYWGNIGSVDFQVNCGGMQQPGCLAFNMPDLGSSVTAAVTCSHLRALDLMIESVNSDQFRGKSCKFCPAVCMSDLLHPTFAIMGEDCPRHLPDDTYWVPTQKSSPYARGCTPFPRQCS